MPPSKGSLSNIEIAQHAKMKPIVPLAKERLGIPEEHLSPFGHYKAKISLDYCTHLENKKDGKLILVTAISPTPAGEGKTTMTVGLGDALNRIGKKAIICLREPALGPVFGMKGGAAGGGYAQVVPMEDINLHFTGDFSAIALANNLLAAMIDNHIHHGNACGFDVRRITWRRVVDCNDRALRDITVGLGGPGNGFPRQDGFDIVVASEVMAIFCLSTSLKDLKERLGKIVVGYTRDQKPIHARDIKAAGAMAALLKDALAPNLVQTLENNPAFIHGGPFANIAHGCNSVMATKTALKLGDYVVTEGGFGADLGAEKFVDIKCRKAGLKPDAAVIVATVRAIKYHGGVEVPDLGKENLKALQAGIANLDRHIDNVRDVFGLPCLVAINHRAEDSEAELQWLQERATHHGVKVIVAKHYSEGGKGAVDVAKEVVELCSARELLQVRLRRQGHALGQDEGGRDQDLRRRRDHGRQQGARADQAAPGVRLRPLPGLRGEDPVLLLDRPEAAWRAARPRREHPRGAPRGGRGVRRDDLRRHHDDAGPAGDPGGEQHRRDRRREDYRAVLSP